MKFLRQNHIFWFSNFICSLSKCLKHYGFLNMALSNVDFHMYFTGATRCRPKKHKKQVSLKSRFWPVIYKGNSTFGPSHFLNMRFSNVDFHLYFTGVIRYFLKQTWNSLSKTILFDLRGLLFLNLRPFGPLLFAWVSQGCLQEPFWPQKAGFT